MEPKNGAIALSASALLFLALAVLTGGIVLYAALAAAAIVIFADFCRYASARSHLGNRLRVSRQLSKSDVLLGSAFTVTYHLEYDGRRTIALQCRQSGGPRLGIRERSAHFDLKPGRQSIGFAATPTARGRHAIPGLEVTFESFLFRGTVTAGGDDEINVYPLIDTRPARVLSRSVPGSAIGNEAIRQGSGSDFSHLRAYTPGDSIRNIDWARTSKYGELVVKDFEDVRPMPLFLLIDVDASMETGDRKTELESAVELATLLSGRVLMENERVGIACFSRSDLTAYVPMASGKAHMARIRELLASVSAVRGAAGPRVSRPVLQEAVAAQKAFGKEPGIDVFSSVLEEAIRQFTVNVREDGFIRAILKVSLTSNVPCHITVATNLSMGMSSLLNGIRIARYYGHNVTVALTPHIWYEPAEGIDAEKCYRKYREAMESITCLRSQQVEVVELSAAERPEEALMAGRGRRSARMVR